MSITIEEVEKMAHLARIAVRDDEKKELHRDLLGIFHWIDQLRCVDVSDVDLMKNRAGESLMHEREDRVDESLSVNDALMNAPQKLHTFFCFPKVIE